MDNWKEFNEGIEKFASSVGVDPKVKEKFSTIVQGEVAKAALALKSEEGQELAKTASVNKDQQSELDKVLLKTASNITDEDMEKVAGKEPLLSADTAGDLLRLIGGAGVGGLGGYGFSKLTGIPETAGVLPGMAAGGAGGYFGPEILEMVQKALSGSGAPSDVGFGSEDQAKPPESKDTGKSEKDKED